MVPDLETRSPRESIELLLRHVAEVVLDSTFSRCIPALIEGAERDQRVRASAFQAALASYSSVARHNRD